ncbi:hypothetical protein ASE23_20205 [Rhizobium sp. Root73]|nr:hypothetical protein ASE23_20205 [Rhizobium sp. Root73]
MSLEQLAMRLGVGPGAKMMNLVAGRHYFPLELAKLTSEILGIYAAKFVYFVLLQYHPKEGVDDTFETICAHAPEGREQTGNPEKTKRRREKRKRRGLTMLTTPFHRQRERRLANETAAARG